MDISIQSLTVTQPKSAPENTQSFLRRLATLVAQIYTTFSQIAQNDTLELHRLEVTYKIQSYGIADLTRSRGNVALGTACISLFLFATSMGFVNENDRKFVQLVSSEAPRIAELFNSQRDAAMKRKESHVQIDGQKITDKISRLHADSSVKDQFASVLQAEIQRCRSAASFQG